MKHWLVSIALSALCTLSLSHATGFVDQIYFDQEELPEEWRAKVACGASAMAVQKLMLDRQKDRVEKAEETPSSQSDSQ